MRQDCNSRSKFVGAVVLAAAMSSAQAESLVRESAEGTTVKLLDQTNVKWSVDWISRYDEDTGDELMRFTHTLEMDIMATDTVQMELAFISQGDPFVDNKKILAEDSAVCQVKQRATDNRFWD